MVRHHQVSANPHDELRQAAGLGGTFPERGPMLLDHFVEYSRFREVAPVGRRVMTLVDRGRRKAHACAGTHVRPAAVMGRARRRPSALGSGRASAMSAIATADIDVVLAP